MKVLQCNYCNKPINSAEGYTVLNNEFYHPNCFLLKDKKSYPIYYSWDWDIHAIKFTINRETKKQSDILIRHKKTKREFIIHNWKRVYSEKGKRYHAWHYEIIENNELFDDGEFILHKKGIVLTQHDFIKKIQERIYELTGLL